MFDFLLQIVRFVSFIWNIIQTIYWWIHEGIVFVFNMIRAVIVFVGSFFANGLEFILPFALVSLIVGFMCLILGRR